ncbi:hypothetical protein Misp01_18750 [Microtetraspora sp. NBRC 13810]|uniref:hypothetical protein n=1 Tax=Microtetraspora sp. NBRC 13810 TaxID=3030990 RepID=UPI0024A43A7F|nr:hypothetical protein [Microtetraspora sp. NBRC 13810]GLW06745.1 hypothetical protein Misp01_18750 [Microtetraspora sp. NBRC 13810]
MGPESDPRRGEEPDGGVAAGTERDPDLADEPDFAGEHTPSATDPPNARPDDGAPDERWDDPTGV